MVLGLPFRRRYRLQRLQLAVGGRLRADAAPYFRIFNPIAQGQKFDREGDYVRRWCPELAVSCPAKFIHAPWEAPALTLASAGVN